MLESTVMGVSKSVVRIFAVIVVYRMPPHASPTLQTLLRAAEAAPKDHIDLKILVSDNTPGGQEHAEVPSGVIYRPAPENPGLARAYNHALEIAGDQGYEWLLTLDQDSVLPLTFLTRIAQLAFELRDDSQVGAIVPQIEGDNRNLSPFRFSLGAIPRCFNAGYIGKARGATYALNSTATIRISALRQIGGYDPMFPIDVSDINLFHRLHLAGYKVFVAGDVLISHEFSVLKKHRRMSIERYRSQLWDECAFWDMNMGPLARLERLTRLLVRVFKDGISQEKRAFGYQAVQEIKRRVLNRRASRIAAWKSWAEKRSKGCALPLASSSEVARVGPKTMFDNRLSLERQEPSVFSEEISDDRKRVQ